MSNIADRVDRIVKEVRGVQSLYDVSSFEMSFLTSIKNEFSLTVKQERILQDIERKVFDDYSRG